MTTTDRTPSLDIDPRAFRHLADAQVGVELDTGDMILNLGPQHPATHGTLRVVAHLDGGIGADDCRLGETVLNCEA